MAINYYVHNDTEARAIIAYESYRLNVASSDPHKITSGDGFGRERCYTISGEAGESLLTVIYLDKIK